LTGFQDSSKIQGIQMIKTSSNKMEDTCEGSNKNQVSKSSLSRVIGHQQKRRVGIMSTNNQQHEIQPDLDDISYGS